MRGPILTVGACGDLCVSASEPSSPYDSSMGILADDNKEAQASDNNGEAISPSTPLAWPLGDRDV
jgi:hypothetical protein